MEMDDIMEQFIDSMPQELNLDYSPESLLRLEEWILKSYPTAGDILKESEKRVLDSLGRYVGQVYRKNLGGKWKLYLDDPNNVFYGLPVIILPSEEIDPICPLSEVTASVDRRKGDYIYTLFQIRIGSQPVIALNLKKRSESLKLYKSPWPLEKFHKHKPLDTEWTI